MDSVGWEISAISKDNLKELFSKYPVCCENPDVLKSLLMDYYPKETARIKIIDTIFRCGIADKLKKEVLIGNIELNRYCSKLESEYGLSKELSRECLLICSQALCIDNPLKGGVVQNNNPHICTSVPSTVSSTVPSNVLSTPPSTVPPTVSPTVSTTVSTTFSSTVPLTVSSTVPSQNNIRGTYQNTVINISSNTSVEQKGFFKRLLEKRSILLPISGLVLLIITGLAIPLFLDNTSVPVNSYEGGQSNFASAEYPSDRQLSKAPVQNSSSVDEQSIIDTQETLYLSAQQLYSSGQYTDATELLEKLGDYKDSKQLLLNSKIAIQEQKYTAAIALYNSQKYDEALQAFENLQGYKESNNYQTLCKNAILEVQYLAAQTLYNSALYTDALSEFSKLGDYKDSVMYKRESSIKAANIGDVIYWGQYEQDNNTNNGSEEIEWIVLQKTDGKLLLLSKYILDWQKYSVSNRFTDCSWENSFIRSWLNETFWGSAFSNSEQKRIQAVNVPVDEKIGNTTIIPGNVTNDRIFLLGYDEYEQYNSNIKPTQFTAYANYKSIINNSLSPLKETERWWLRHRCYRSGECRGLCAFAYTISIDAEVKMPIAQEGIRPAMWISIQ